MTTLPDPSTLQAFDHAAAGHDGVMTDADHTLIIKPCTAAEIDFYQHATTNFPSLANFMPQFMGTLQLSKETQTPATTTTEETPTEAALRLKGRPIDSDTSIVLSDVTAGFVKPCVLDLKLGARLWADDAAVEKRERLDAVAAKTTSKPLGFRVAGMRVWQGDGDDATTKSSPAAGGQDAPETTKFDAETGYLVYNKLFGRELTASNVAEAFKSYLGLSSPMTTTDVARTRAKRLLKHIGRELADLRDALSALETRMYSASVLLVYEGELEAYAAAKDLEDARLEFERSLRAAGTTGNGAMTEEARFADADDAELEDGGAGEDDDDDDEDMDDDNDDDEEEIPEPKTYAVKMIDFAHASATPGQGPDENVLHGIRSILKIVQELEADLK